eukprot:Nk52_evm71s151 gene=Nk52_evmTU71s151
MDPQQASGFCGSSSFGPFDSHGLFTDCFQQFILSALLPLVFLLTVGTFALRNARALSRAGYKILPDPSSSERSPLLAHSQSSNSRSGALNGASGDKEGTDYDVVYGQGRFVLRYILIVVCAGAHAFRFFMELLNGADSPMYESASSLTNVFAWVYFLVLFNAENSEALYGKVLASWTSTVFTCIYALVSVFPAIAIVNSGDWTNDNSVKIMLYLCYFALAIVSIHCSIVYPSQTVFAKGEPREFRSSYAAQMLFTWFDPMAKLGNQRRIEPTDLYRLEKKDQSKFITDRFCDIHERRASPGPWNLLYEMGLLTWFDFGLNGAWMLMNSLFTFTGPYFLNRIVDYIQHSNDPESEQPPAYIPVYYAMGMLFGLLFNGIAQNQAFHTGRRIIVQVRAGIIGIVYRKVLRYSPSHSEVTVGGITNLMSVDATRIANIGSDLHEAWSTPLICCISMYSLYQLLGWASMAGCAVMVLMIPVNMIVVKKIEEFQDALLEKTDKRVASINEMLSSIRIIKFFAWEDKIKQKINKHREDEVRALRYFKYILACTTVLYTGVPTLVSLTTFVTYTKVLGNELHATEAFTALALFNTLRGPLFYLPMIMTHITELIVSLRRVDSFLTQREIEQTPAYKPNEPIGVRIKNGEFSWDQKTKTLKNINLDVKKGELVAVVGQTGSGKSSLVMAILNEIECMSGSTSFNGKIAYVSQQAWIMNATIRDNILFGKPFDEARYKKVCQVCCLAPDFKLFDAGDMVEIGEKGINMSGGQKQRISLARAVYQDADIIIMDDPLSAVDAHVGKALFENCMLGMLKNKTRILVSHQIGLVLPQSDKIVMMKDGAIIEQGTFKELSAIKSSELNRLMESVGTSDDKDESEEEIEEMKLKQKTDALDIENVIAKTEENRVKGMLIDEEHRETGKINTQIYFTYAAATGGAVFVVLYLIAFVLSQVFTVLQDYAIRLFAAQFDKPGVVDTDFYLIIFGAMAVLTLLFLGLTDFGQSILSIRASIKLHDDLLNRVFRAPVRFFDTTPMGRIVNRFTKDMEGIDQEVADMIYFFIMQVLATGSIVALVGAVTPSFILALIPVSYIFYLVTMYYLRCSTELKRIDSTTRSPVYSHFTESVNGALTIRAYGVGENFKEVSERKLDSNHQAYWLLWVSNRWLGLRLTFASAIVILSCAVSALASCKIIDPGLAGLSLTYALQFSVNLRMLVRAYADMENFMNTVERVKEYSNIEQEPPAILDHNRPPTNWPSKGCVTFENVVLSYAPDLPAVIKGISFEVKGGHKVGIVGRTGAGKSTITLAMFRFMEALEGRIKVDGIDISQIGLEDLRSNISIIPQDPVLFAGSIRSNLDPFNECSDYEMWKALENVELGDYVRSLEGQLDYEVTENGENISVGQRQLMCLARALLKKSSLLIMDEATANVDVETDDLIQETIRKHFKNSTILTIAHRLKTIIDYDRVLVLDAGKVAEYDTPKKLLQIEDGIFKSMCENSGQYDSLAMKANERRRASIGLLQQLSQPSGTTNSPDSMAIPDSMGMDLGYSSSFTSGSLITRAMIRSPHSHPKDF